MCCCNIARTFVFFLQINSNSHIESKVGPEEEDKHLFSTALNITCASCQNWFLCNLTPSFPSRLHLCSEPDVGDDAEKRQKVLSRDCHGSFQP